MTSLPQANRAAPQRQAATCESVEDIINIAATAEAFAVTLLGGALAAAAEGTLPLNAEAIGTLTAARAAEHAHFEVLTAAGAQPLTQTFTVPDPALLTDTGLFLTTLVNLEEAFVAAYLTAAQEFAVLGEAELTQLALQIGAVEAEHRVGARFFAIQAGALTGVPNDLGFEKALFGSVEEAATALEDLGFIGGSGAEIAFPGPGAIDTTGVHSLRP
jgi:hypothetical protein